MRIYETQLKYTYGNLSSSNYICSLQLQLFCSNIALLEYCVEYNRVSMKQNCVKTGWDSKLR